MSGATPPSSPRPSHPAPTSPIPEPAPSLTRSIRIQTPSRDYDVLIGAGVLRSFGEAVRSAAADARRAALFCDTGLIGGGTPGLVDVSLRRAGFEVVHTPAMRIEPSEIDKSLATVELVLRELARARLERSDVVVVLGGGVLGDTVGFAAATYRRGVRWINCPTTLLAMVDAAVGGKTGVNLTVDRSLKKNMVGAFWQPSLVAADVSTLTSLSDRHLSAGLAECIKHGMLAADFGDPGLGAWTISKLEAIRGCAPAPLVELVARNVAVKAAVVGMDEREERPAGERGRALLNLGHTFAHAIETMPTLTPDGNPLNAPLEHGEAVGLGLVAAAAAAAHMGICPQGMVESVRSALSAAGLPASVVGLPDDDELLDLMLDDKKVAGGELVLVLPSGDGRARVVPNPPREAVIAGWQAIRAE